MTFVEMLSPAAKDIVKERKEIIPDIERTFSEDKIYELVRSIFEHGKK